MSSRVFCDMPGGVVGRRRATGRRWFARMRLRSERTALRLGDRARRRVHARANRRGVQTCTAIETRAPRRARTPPIAGSRQSTSGAETEGLNPGEVDQGAPGTERAGGLKTTRKSPERATRCGRPCCTAASLRASTTAACSPQESRREIGPATNSAKQNHRRRPFHPREGREKWLGRSVDDCWCSRRAAHWPARCLRFPRENPRAGTSSRSQTQSSSG